MQGIDGFLGSRASFMLDVVALAMALLLPVLGWSIYLVKYRQNYSLHKRVQLTLGAVLFVTVLLFEVDMRINGWRDRAAASPYGESGGGVDWVFTSLGVHLCFAITTAVLWAAVIIRACARFRGRRRRRRTARGIAAMPDWRPSTWFARPSPAGSFTGWRSWLDAKVVFSLAVDHEILALLKAPARRAPPRWPRCD